MNTVTISAPAPDAPQPHSRTLVFLREEQFLTLRLLGIEPLE